MGGVPYEEGGGALYQSGVWRSFKCFGSTVAALDEIIFGCKYCVEPSVHPGNDESSGL